MSVIKNRALPGKRLFPMGAITTFLDGVKNATLSLTDLFAKVGEFCENFLAIDVIATVQGMADGFIANIPFGSALVFMVVGLLIALFGKRILGALKFVAAVIVGFGVGTLYLAPLVSFVPQAWIVGAVCAVVFALLFKVVYIVGLVAISGYSVYWVAFTAAVLPQVTAFTKGNMIYSAVAAVVAVVLVLVLLKFVEKVYTAVLGAWMITTNLVVVWDPRSLGVLTQNDLILYIVMGVLALIGLLVQIKTRKRY